MSKRKDNLLFTFSGMTFLLMIASPNKSSIILNIILGLILVVICNYMPNIIGYIKINIRRKHVVIGAIVDIFIGFGFYEKWKPSGTMLLIANIVGLDSGGFIAAITIIGCIFIALFCVGVVVILFDCSEKNINNNLFKFLNSNSVYMCCCIITIIGLACQIYFSFSKDIWLDEAFSLKMIEHSYKEMIILTAQDVHPPLYYIILKGSIDLVHIIIPWISQIYIAKLVSVCPYVIIMLYSWIFLRKRYGNFVSGLFSVCLISMPQLISYGVEIRMYSWGLFFVSASFFSMYGIITEKKKSNWIKFLIFSLMAAFTHYFACISVAFFYLMLFIWFFIKKKEMLKKWFALSFLTVIGYMPWLLVLIKQLAQVKEGYWITEINFQSIIYYITFIFQRYWLFILYILAIFICIKKMKENNTELFFAFIGLMTSCWTVGVGVIMSNLFRPIFISRYVLPSLGCLWFGIIIFLSYQKEIRIRLIISIALLTVCIGNILSFVQKEQVLKNDSLNLQCLVSKIDGRNNKIITTASNDNRILAAKVKGNCYLWKENESKLSENVYGNVHSVKNVFSVEKWLQSGDKVFLIVNVEASNDSIKNLFDSKYKKLKKIGNYTLERPIEAYEIILKKIN